MTLGITQPLKFDGVFSILLEYPRCLPVGVKKNKTSRYARLSSAPSFHRSGIHPNKENKTPEILSIATLHHITLTPKLAEKSLLSSRCFSRFWESPAGPNVVISADRNHSAEILACLALEAHQIRKKSSNDLGGSINLLIFSPSQECFLLSIFIHDSFFRRHRLNLLSNS